MHTPAPVLLSADAVIAAPLVNALARLAPDLQLLPYSRSLDDATLAGIEVVLGWRFAPGVAGRLTNLRWMHRPVRGGHGAAPCARPAPV